MGKLIDLTGQTFGLLRVIGRAPNRYGRACWICECQCKDKTIIEASSNHLRTGQVRSCGCLRVKRATENLNSYFESAKFNRHDMSRSRLYNIWNSLISRCENKNIDAYRYYGVYGIRVCNEWRDNFIEFYNWALENGYSDNLYIQRINRNGNYEPSNCKWVTKREQLIRKNTLLITIDDEQKTLSEWCRVYGIGYNVVKARVSHGWDVQKALTTPVRQKKQKYINK